MESLTDEQLLAFFATLQVTIITDGDELEIAKECYEGWPNENVDYYKIYCTAQNEGANGDTVYFLQNKDTKKYFMFLDRSEFESDELRDMLVASQYWLI